MNNWIKTLRLQTLPLSVSGIILGSFIAMSKGFFDVKIFIFSITTTLLFQILSNIANDYGDHQKGTDHSRNDRGLITQNSLKKAIIITIILSLLSSILLIYLSFKGDDIWISLFFITLAIISVISAIKYTIGKNSYGYNALGDLFVFIFFGLVSVLGSYFLQAKSFDWGVLLIAIPSGFLSVGVLNINNIRDFVSDKFAYKNTLVVKMGIPLAKVYHEFLIILSFISVVFYNYLNFKSPWQYLFLILVIPFYTHYIKIIKISKNISNNRDLYNTELKKLAILTFIFSIVVSLGNNL